MTIGAKHLREQDVIHGAPILNARFFRRSFLEEVGPFDTRWRRCADFDLLMRVLDLAPERATVDQVVYRSRAHPDSLTFRGGLEIELTDEQLALCTARLAETVRRATAASSISTLAQLGVRLSDVATAAKPPAPSSRRRARSRDGRRSPPARRGAGADRATSPHANTAPMTQRVALVALTTTGAAGDYVAALGTALAARTTVGMWIPDRPSLHPDGVADPRRREGVDARRGRRSRDDRRGFGPGHSRKTSAPGSRTSCTSSSARAIRRRRGHASSSWRQASPSPRRGTTPSLTARSSTGCSMLSLSAPCVRLRASTCTAASSCPTASERLRGRAARVPVPWVHGHVDDAAPAHRGRDHGCRAVRSVQGDRSAVQCGGRAVAQRWRPPARRRRPGLGSPVASAPRASVAFARHRAQRVRIRSGAARGAGIVRRVCDAVPQRHAVGVAVVGADARRAPDRVRCRLHRQHGPAAGRASGARPGRSSALADALLEPPSAWTDVARVPLPTFADLADRLLEWYPTLSAG